ncbi:MAG: DUF4982 domain-containing protein [Methylacidiphilales bacterium]|nr:DUF4982 domain-containing protein [Candidatus Methylacidiphilales bacterium]
MGQIQTYGSTKAGQVLGAAAPAFDDSQWKRVDLPHDWVIDQAFDPDATVANGYLPRGVAWYRRAFLLDPADAESHLSIEFDGVFRDARVWLNGHYLGNHPSGYTSFDFSISDIAYYGDIPNVLVVRTDSRAYEGWWYEGGGIYRHVWLVKATPLHVAKWGVCVRPSRVSTQQWRVEIETELENDGLIAAGCEIHSEIIAPDGKKIAEAPGQTIQLAQKTRVTAKQETVVENPMLWSLEKTTLYTLRTTLRDGKTFLDQNDTTFGFREIRFSPNEGFFLNGKHILIQGTCNHQDHAGVGIGIPDGLQVWRIRKLKEAGCNAYRCAHHPPTPELLDICDREGMLVLDENRHLRSSPEAMADLESMVRRDRNHPCVILWSICNEEYLQGSKIGGRIAASLVARVRQLDPSRPTTGALLSTAFGPGMEDQVDVIGVNYSASKWSVLHKAHPNKGIVATETTAAVSTRGIYETNEFAGYCTSYDEQFCPGGTTIRETWLDILARPYMAGGFVWVGLEYRGEQAPYAWPTIGAQLGFFDTCGFPKDAFYLYQAFWTQAPMVHLLPHWNWAGREGENIRVVAYSNCEKVELFLNGKSLGEKEVPKDHAVEWSIPYQPGTLSAEARKEREVAARTKRVTADAPAGIRLKLEPCELRANAEDVSVVTVEIIDEKGQFVPTADILVKFAIRGPARIIGVGNGNPVSYESDTAKQRTTFNGLCQVLVQASDTAGEIVLSASADGLGRGELKIVSRKAERRPYVPALNHLQLVDNWRKSPPVDLAPGLGMGAANSTEFKKPDAAKVAISLVVDPESDKYDPSTWEPVTVHSAFPNFPAENQAIGYHAEISIPTLKRTKLAFTRVWGRGTLYLNRKPVHKIKEGTESFSIDLPEKLAGQKVTVDVVLQYVYSGAGINGWVWITA